MKIGIVRETRDSRTPLTPPQCAQLRAQGIQLKVQTSGERCFSDDEYRSAEVDVVQELDDCTFLLGVKEVAPEALIQGRTYMFFSHTIKAQPYNRELLQEILAKSVRLIDYECLKDAAGRRVVAFGRWAGINGAYNALAAWGMRTGAYSLAPLQNLPTWEEALKQRSSTQLPRMKIILTGNGRVAQGAAEAFADFGITQVSPTEFLASDYNVPVFAQLSPQDMYAHKSGAVFDEAHYFEHPEDYTSTFAPYTATAEIMVNGIYWDQRIPVFFSAEDMCKPSFKIALIADITCDIAPDASVPSTLRASTIAAPVYGYDPATGKETAPYQTAAIDIMAVDNLPNQLPRDASTDFGNQLLTHVLPALCRENDPLIKNATIAENGRLTTLYSYLKDFVAVSS